jgi:hypothetical protein
MSMWLILAKVEVGLLEAVRADPGLLSSLLFDDGEAPIPDELSAAFDAGSDVFEADYRTLSAIADALPAQEWFQKATGDGTESLPYDDLTYGPAFAHGPQEVSDVAAGLVAEGWHAGGVSTNLTDESDASVQRSAQALGTAAEWDPDEIESYGPMMAATGSAAFNTKVVQAIGSIADWDGDTIERVTAAVTAAEPEELGLDDDNDLAGFFLTAAAQGRAVVGGIN